MKLRILKFRIFGKLLGMDTLSNDILDESTLFFSPTTSKNKIYCWNYFEAVVYNLGDLMYLSRI